MTVAERAFHPRQVQHLARLLRRLLRLGQRAHKRGRPARRGGPLRRPAHAPRRGQRPHAVCDLLINEGADLQQAGLMRDCPLSRRAQRPLPRRQVPRRKRRGTSTASLTEITPRYTGPPCADTSRSSTSLLQSGADKSIRNKQGKVPIDLCEPVWSLAWKYTRRVAAVRATRCAVGRTRRLRLCVSLIIVVDISSGRVPSIACAVERSPSSSLTRSYRRVASRRANLHPRLFDSPVRFQCTTTRFRSDLSMRYFCDGSDEEVFVPFLGVVAHDQHRRAAIFRLTLHDLSHGFPRRVQDGVECDGLRKGVISSPASAI